MLFLKIKNKQTKEDKNHMSCEKGYELQIVSEIINNKLKSKNKGSQENFKFHISS